MFPRQVNISKSNSFFLFGARGTGKTHLLSQFFKSEPVLWIDLLQAQTELQLLEDPDRLSAMCDKMPGQWVVIDEVQKLPKLLDIAHREIERRGIKFALTGSSARKLKRGGANLLAARAFVFNLFPLTHQELGKEFDLLETLQWGSLPKLYSLTAEDKNLFLASYVDTYLKEEIFAEQLVRNVVPFKKFLKVAAQANGAVINFNQIAKDLNIDNKTVRTYFDILEDTLVGFYLPATNTSFRKQQIKSPKFYLFDCGVKRAIEGVSHLPITSAQELGMVFEHWLVLEIFRLNSYLRNKYELSYLLTKAGLEIDLVLQAPREKTVFLEIKSSKQLSERHLAGLLSVRRDYPDNRYLCACREEHPRVYEGVEILPWQQVFSELGLHHLQKGFL
ncbi:MAG: ATP-binding protein [Deltaproteobacteria bacterium]|nr:ATP-binding protein [Deltaproteobacteria bacterium]